MRKRIIALILLVMLAAALAAAAFISVLLNSPPEGSINPRYFEVPPGEYFSTVAERLEDEGVIRSALFIRLLGKIDQRSTRIKQGTYSINPEMSSNTILDLLVEGQQRLFPVTVPEGYTARAIASVMEEAGICGVDDFLKAVEEHTTVLSSDREIKGAEGLLFPDTYLFQKDFPANLVVNHMVETFFTQLEEIAPDFLEWDVNELYNRIILASIVEREYRRADEASLIASVFMNRIELGMPLQSCATVVYVLVEERGQKHPNRITFSDLEVESRFNTYIKPGLPPAPIANPGLTALDAAFNPKTSDYLFFALKNPDTGEHIFSKNYRDHDEAYNLYIKER